MHYQFLEQFLAQGNTWKILAAKQVSPLLDYRTTLGLASFPESGPQYRAWHTERGTLMSRGLEDGRKETQQYYEML